MLPTVYHFLQDSDVLVLVDDRIYRHGEAPEGVTAPYVTWFVVSAAPENYLEGLPRIDNYNVQVDCWSDNEGTGDEGVETLAEAVRNALEAYGYMTGVVINGKDPETKRFRIGMTFTLWTSRVPLPIEEEEEEEEENPIPALGPVAYFQFNEGIASGGGFVSQWNDQSGNGRHLVQATGTNQPALQVDGSILFDGVDNIMRTANFTLNQPNTRYLRLKVVSYDVNDTVFDGSGVFTGWMVATGISPRFVVSAGTSLGPIEPPVGSYVSIAVVFNGVSSVLQLSGQAAITGDAGAINSGGFAIGGRPPGGTNAANIEVKEVAIFNTAHDAATRASILAYLDTL